MLRGPRRLVQDLAGLQRAMSAADFAKYMFSFCRHIPEVVRARSLMPIDFANGVEECAMTVQGTRVRFENESFAGAREMYARQVYFAEFPLPSSGWAIDLGANAGLFSTLAATHGLSVLAVEPQPGFEQRFADRMTRNGVPRERWALEHAFIGDGGMLADDGEWNATTHGGGVRPPVISFEALLKRHGIERVEFLKMDIEGAEYDLFAKPDWLMKVERLAMEIHGEHGDPNAVARTLRDTGFNVRLRDIDLQPRSTLNETGYLYAWR